MSSPYYITLKGYTHPPLIHSYIIHYQYIFTCRVLLFLSTVEYMYGMLLISPSLGITSEYTPPANKNTLIIYNTYTEWTLV